MTQFIGIKLVTLAFYNGLTDEEKSGYLFLVRDGEYNEDGTIKGNPTSEEIYFGKRKYADTSHRFISNIFEAFGGLLDSEGGFILPIGKDFVSFDDSKAENLSDILYALDAALKANVDKFEEYYTKTKVDEIKSTIETAIESCLTGVSVKVGETTYDGVFADGVATVDLTNAFEAAGKVKDVTVNGVSVMDGTTAKIDLSGKADASTVKTLSDKVGALELFKHASDVVYNTETKFIQLKDSDGNVLGNGFDASPFIVDGMLNDVDFVKDDEGENTSTLRFTFNADGKNKTIDVDFAKYVDVYHADGTSIELDSTNNTFSVKEVDATKTKLGTDIQIAGGPLANNVAESNEVWPWKDEAGNKIIPSGKSMEEILTALFLKLVNGTVKWGSASWSPTLANPTVTLSTNGPVEVGSTVTISTLTEGAADAKKRSVTCTCSQGHFLADADGNPTGSHVSGNKTVSVNASISGTASLACTWNGNTINASDNLVVGEATNTVSASQSGQIATCDALPSTKVFASTNTKSVLSDVSATFSESKPADKPLTSSATDTIEGKYKYFIGCYGDSTFADKTYTVESIRTTDKKQEGFMNGKTISTTITVPTGTKGMYIAIPEGVDNTGASLNVIQTTALNTPVGGEMAENVRAMNAFACAGTATKNYKVFTWSFPGGTAGEETFSITSF